MTRDDVPANPEHRLTDREVLAFELERVWRSLTNIIDRGRDHGRVNDGRPLRVPAKFITQAKQVRNMVRELAVEAAPKLGVCRSPVVDVGEVVAPTPTRRQPWKR